MAISYFLPQKQKKPSQEEELSQRLAALEISPLQEEKKSEIAQETFTSEELVDTFTLHLSQEGNNLKCQKKTVDEDTESTWIFEIDPDANLLKQSLIFDAEHKRCEKEVCVYFSAGKENVKLLVTRKEGKEEFVLQPKKHLPIQKAGLVSLSVSLLRNTEEKSS